MKKLIIANWKNYLTAKETIGICNIISEIDNIIISPSMIYLSLIEEKFPQLKLAAQDVSALASGYGASTGETPVSLLNDLNIKYAIIGHSERRSNNLDNKDTIAKKISFCNEAGITPIICIGESLKDRENARHVEIITSQINSMGLSDFSNVIVAYEPTWSVGTGVLPSLEEIKEIMNIVKSAINFVDNKNILVYGGSVSTENAESILAIPEVGGLLVGKAATDASQLRSILNFILKE